ncbi:hypothetical protein [Alkalimarinus alittae]|uniref:Uncharacterized protein n=1 Tax=Alkalimarinus alittae TaxID=2961619 RepID=A0ABY6N4D1_9ALTE|nr:hypothetical protein [Alkalimarinus alittae]UZE96944.1 hypothetical protein NKI27_04110 [Alkalimarinus alittae]
MFQSKKLSSSSVRVFPSTVKIVDKMTQVHNHPLSDKNGLSPKLLKITMDWSVESVLDGSFDFAGFLQRVETLNSHAEREAAVLWMMIQIENAQAEIIEELENLSN